VASRQDWTREQAVRVYSFEPAATAITTCNPAERLAAGLPRRFPPRSATNQLLTTNSVELLAEQRPTNSSTR